MSTTSGPPWELYETLLEVMRAGSLSGASRAMQVAQPTVRRRMEQLEAALQVVLFTRTTTGLVPTEAGQATLSHAQAMASSAQALVRATSGGQGEARGTVRISASEVIGGEVLPGLLHGLRDSHPGLQLELVLSNRATDLLRRDADVAVRMVAPTQAALVARKVGSIPIGLFARKDYLRGRPAVRALADLLTGHALIGQDRERGLIEALAQAGLTTTPRDYAIRADSDLAQLGAIRAGLGIGVAQVALAARTPVLERVLPALEVPLHTWVVTHEDLRAVRRVRLVFDALVEQLTAYAREGAARSRTQAQAMTGRPGQAAGKK